MKALKHNYGLINSPVFTSLLETLTLYLLEQTFYCNSLTLCWLWTARAFAVLFFSTSLH